MPKNPYPTFYFIGAIAGLITLLGTSFVGATFEQDTQNKHPLGDSLPVQKLIPPTPIVTASAMPTPQPSSSELKNGQAKITINNKEVNPTNASSGTVNEGTTHIQWDTTKNSSSSISVNNSVEVHNTSSVTNTSQTTISQSTTGNGNSSLTVQVHN